MTFDRGQSALARAKAVEVLRLFNVEAVEEIDIEAFAFHHRLRVVDGGLRGARGRLVSKRGRGIVRVGDDVKQQAQRRFIIAHELGHHLLHAARGKASVCLGDDLVRYESAEPEAEANRFASDLLLPRELFERYCDVDRPSFQVIEKASALFSTTLTATAIRFVDFCPVPCAVVWSQESRIKWAARGPEFYGWIPFGAPLDPNSYAFDAFRGELVRDAPQMVAADAWAERLRAEEIYEHTRWFAGLRATLTLLWIPP